MSCAALRIHPARWLDPELRQDPRIKKLMERIVFDVRCEEQEFAMAKLKDSHAEPAGVEVVTKGKTFRKVVPYRKGLSYHEEFRNTDEELIQKFRENVSRLLTPKKTDKAIKTLFELEKLKNVAELMKMFTP